MVEDPHDNYRSDCHEMDEEKSRETIQGNIISTTLGEASSTMTDPVRLATVHPHDCAGGVSVLGVFCADVVPSTLSYYCSWF